MAFPSTAHWKKNVVTIVSGVVAAFFLFFFAPAVHAATFSLSPAAGNYLTGHTFTMNVLISSPGAAMNAAQAALSFPADKLSVISLSKSDSILDLWVQNPSFSNKDGTINLSGIVTNPGFQGSGGVVLAITFQAKNPGAAAISFLSGSILANDGLGTNILSGMKGAAITVTALPASSGVVTPGSTKGLVISSDPPIKSDQWYGFDTVLFQWSLPIDVDGVNYALSSDLGYQLPKTAQNPVTKISYDTTRLTDGIWYFYASYESGGVWAPVTSRVLHLDRTPPDPFVITLKDQDGTFSRPAFQWAAIDKTSGIAYYQAKIGDGDWFNPAILANKNSLYTLPVQSPTSRRLLTVRAYDYAGNFREASFAFNVAETNNGCLAGGPLCFVQYVFGQWNWPLVLAILFCTLMAYWFVFRVFAWRRKFQKELSVFKSELHHDLKELEERVSASAGRSNEVDLRPSHLAAKKELEKTVEHLAEDVKEELGKIEKL